MPTRREIIARIETPLTALYGEREARQIARIVVMELGGLCLTDLVAEPDKELGIDELDRIIEQRQTFNDKKEERISELKRMLDVTGLSPRQEYDINARLCDQYWKYNLDSAIR